MIRKPEEMRTVFPVKWSPAWLGSASTSFTILPPATQLADAPSAKVNASAPTDARERMTHATLKSILHRRGLRRIDNPIKTNRQHGPGIRSLRSQPAANSKARIRSEVSGLAENLQPYAGDTGAYTKRR